MIIPWSWYELSKTWQSYHDHAMNHDDHAKKHGRHAIIMAWSWSYFTMIMARSWYDHGKIMVWSWQDHAMAAMSFQPGLLKNAAHATKTH